MCTLTIVRTDRGFSLMSNRDERTTRPAALPPAWYRVDGVDVLFPIDPPSGGTWLAVNRAGLAMALMNRTPAAPAATLHGKDYEGSFHHSRGEIIPKLIAAQSLSDVRRRLRAIDAELYDRFRIAAAWRGEILVATSDGVTLNVGCSALTDACVFTSSSLGDARAERLRVPLFETLVRRSDRALIEQRRFHDHQWADCPAFSVRMARADARTVSRSHVIVESNRVSFDYEPAAHV